MGKLKGHDDYVNDLVKLIDEQYLGLIKKFDYGSAVRILGEVDVIGISTGRFDLYEVKSNRNTGSLRKAVSQLKTARAYLGQAGREFVYTPKGGIEPIEKIIQELWNRKV